jgi:hypothetical protein
MPIASRAAADRSTAYLWPSMTTVFVQWILIHRLPSSDQNMRVRERRKSRIVSGENSSVSFTANVRAEAFVWK